MPWNFIAWTYTIVETRLSFWRKFKVTKRPKRDTIEVLFQKFQQTGNVNDDRSGNGGRPFAAVTEVNAEVVEKVI